MIENNFTTYKRISRLINQMRTSVKSLNSQPSLYWQEEVAGFDYLFNATPEIVDNFRDHCYHITGIHSYEYRSHHSYRAKRFKKKLDCLKALDESNLFIPESPQLGGFGHLIDGQLVNIDTLKFYESALAINRSDSFFVKNRNNPLLAVEIGGGWGGFAHVFKQLVPGCTYVIIDLAETFYISCLYPAASVYIYDPNNFKDLRLRISSYDFAFIPHYALSEFCLDYIDIAINMISFQEMTQYQVNEYLVWLKSCNAALLYSHNRSRSKYNAQILDVHDIIRQYYELQFTEILPVPYNILDYPQNTVRDKGNPLNKFILYIIKFLYEPCTKYMKQTWFKVVKPDEALLPSGYKHALCTKPQ